MLLYTMNSYSLGGDLISKLTKVTCPQKISSVSEVLTSSLFGVKLYL